MSRNRARRRRLRQKRRGRAPGSPPGLLTPTTTDEVPQITVVRYDEGSVRIDENALLEDVVQAKADQGVLWVNVEGTTSAHVISHLGERFGLHALSLEDATTNHQHVKTEAYADNLYVVLRVPVDAHGYTTEQLNLFLGDGFVITMQATPLGLVSALAPRLKDEHSKLRRTRADFLAYAILDLIIDRYFPVVEQFGEELDAIEDRLSQHPPREIMHEVHDIRVALRNMRRIVWQLRDVSNTLQRDDTGHFSESTKTFLRDCHDHTVQLIELLEIGHETCSDLRDIYLSEVSNRLNEVMMVLTIIATIFIPLGFITGLYGMNFQTSASPWNMPELNWYWGYPFSLGLMLATAGGMILFFRRRGWIGERGPNRPPHSTTRDSHEGTD